MTTDEWARTIRIVDMAFAALAGTPNQGSVAALKAKLADGKLYELRVLAWLLARLANQGYSARLMNGPNVLLRHAPGPVDRSSPFIELVDAAGHLAGEVWCNVEFVGVGFELAEHERPPAGNPEPVAPDYHELDIAVTLDQPPDGYLRRGSISIGCECKDRALEKRMLREMLGLRRELSLMSHAYGKPQFFLPGMSPVQSQDPPIRLFLCSSSPLPADYEKIAEAHAIHVVHVPV